MKICLVSYIAPYTIPYINIYINKIREARIECDIVFWDRDGNYTEKTEEGIHYIPFSSEAKQNDSKIKRYWKYIPATNFIRKQLIKNGYDKIIFLQTHAAIACGDIITRRFPKKYIIDIRDFTLENFRIFREFEKKVIWDSYCTVISSKGYVKFLPKYEYVVAHNFTKVENSLVEEICNKSEKDCINISFIGYVRFYEMAKKILTILSNDSRFHISYIGTGAMALEPFCKEHHIKNVTLHDRFDPADTANFYKECDLINNLYGNHDNYLDYALSNKLYYAAQFNIPVLVCEDTYSSQIAEKYNIGISWNPDEVHAADTLFNKYHLFNRELMRKKTVEFIDIVKNENTIFEEKINNFIYGE